MNTSNNSQTSPKSEKSQQTSISRTSIPSQSVILTSKSELNNPPKKFVELSLFQSLSFEKFIFTDMSLFNATVTSVAKKLLSPEVQIP